MVSAGVLEKPRKAGSAGNQAYRGGKTNRDTQPATTNLVKPKKNHTFLSWNRRRGKGGKMKKGARLEETMMTNREKEISDETKKQERALSVERTSNHSPKRRRTDSAALTAEKSEGT